VRALFIRDRQKADNAREAARIALATSMLETDDRHAAELRLQYYKFQIAYLLGEEPEARLCFDEFGELLATPHRTRLAESERNRFLLLVENVADIEGWADLKQARVEELLEQIPEDSYDGELWYNIAGWAFRHRCKPLVERAFEEMTIRRKGSISDMTWKRINLMYLLLEQRAAAKDVEEYLKDITLVHAFEEFWKHIWPLIEEQGLGSEELEAYARGREKTLTEAGPNVPHQPSSTVRIRRDLSD
jgi:hypothetical protein